MYIQARTDNRLLEESEGVGRSGGWGGGGKDS